ncbi:uncharacterized protein CANTADRAFT_268618 [Suhomyces tanzawaensis NRRL Y-17324]|uniref:Uncharacterized protein n=1 Tax=Suhomyces tanzawaensis NRRL Y-17324 TaxID=984487 RepID=A0A1E4SGB0_9ASCO|nr:uncharacterized protein CANTADRAFT_268618 [Suhomyces tanzawaensis NRRL Y-17324]ODV78547.1 hypothetical protein CANTADRAFT_268618 [Suhomyces tanzawaensis NRRL Y-17324]
MFLISMYLSEPRIRDYVPSSGLANNPESNKDSGIFTEGFVCLHMHLTVLALTHMSYCAAYIFNVRVRNTDSNRRLDVYPGAKNRGEPRDDNLSNPSSLKMNSFRLDVSQPSSSP